ncbi:pH-response regulator protein palI/rim-9 [Ceratocystis platani]|uniref:pH-response regulator protein palI/rim-9 n=1 Tax=Ceratocystis fimbriata f. sp. platani TaxID=88771 RepID=A0A0F8DE76_CERFI|nr:pH-response regulator protein palI/rim-9 [Ceratocystis platani]
MLRPATPLSLILVVAFGLLVLSVLSTPVIKGVPLGTFNDFDYGVFGFCHVDDCSGFQVGYKVCSIMACAMRRTLVSRKSRKKKIAEHAEMNGENFYNRENAIKAANAAVAPVPSIPAIPAIPAVPSVNKSTSDGHTAFATFESSKEKANSQVSEERIPLTSQNSIHRMNSADQNNDMPLPPPPVNMGGYGGPPRSNSAPPQVDQYGNPIDNGQSMYAGNYNASVDRFNNYSGRGGPQNFRGRGGYGRGGSRGGYNGPNNYPNNGNGYGGPRRGDGSSYGPRGGYGPGPRGPGRPRQPPANYQNDNGYNNYQDTYNMPHNNMNMNQGGYNDGYVDTYNNNNMIPNNDGYNNIGNNSNNDNNPNSYVPYSQQQLVIDSYTSDNAQNPTNPMREFNFETENNPDASGLNLPRAESPPPLPADLAATAPPASGSPAPVAFEMEGSPTEPKASLKSESPQEAKVDVELDGAPQPPRLGDGPRQTFVSAASKYSQDGPDGPDNGSVPPSPNNGWGNTARPSALPSPLALGREPSPSKISENGPPGHGAYYEDVDPRYDNPPISPMPVAPPSHEIMITPPEVTIDDIPGKSDPRSPGCESDVSNFTSISQRGINPRWNPNAPPMPPFGGGGPMGGPRGPGHGPGPRPRPRQNLGPGPGQGGPWVGGGGGSRRPPPAQQRQDMLLNSNPDFALPGRR